MVFGVECDAIVRIGELVLMWVDNAESLRAEVNNRVGETERWGSIDMQIA